MSRKKVLVVGDIIIDRYVYVRSVRRASEAPIPVWDLLYREDRLGGAANVANNLKVLGGNDIDVFLAGIFDESEPGWDSGIFQRNGIDTTMCDGYHTMIKERFVDKDNSQIVFRCDEQLRFDRSSVGCFEGHIRSVIRDHSFDAVIFSDYDKGTITQNIIDIVSPRANLKIVDSKRVDLSIFKGMDLLKVNEQEYSIQVSRGPYTNVESMFKAVVVTKGNKGATLRQSLERIQDRRVENQPQLVQSSQNVYIIDSEDFPSIAVNAKDVTGCGDTHTAAMTFSLLRNDDLRLAVKFGNECARNVVQKFGTSVVTF